MKFLSKKNTYYYLYFSFLLLFSVLVLVKINFAIYLVFTLLGFGWSIFFFGKRLNILEHFFLSFVVFSVLFICFAIFCALLGVKLVALIGIVFLVLSILVFLLTKTFESKNINLKIEKYDYLILLLFFLVIIAKVISVRSFIVPSLHDPITHTYYSKQIVDTGFIRFFYSPGLHIISAFGKMFNGYDEAKQILYITNFFNAYVGVLAYLFVKHTFKRNVWALVTAMLFSLGFYPALFFIEAGKNSLVVGLVFFLFFLFFITKYREEKKLRLLILGNLIIMSIFIVHYPIAVFACTYLLALFFVDFKKEKFRTVLLGIGILFAFAWVLKTYEFYSLENSVQFHLLEASVQEEETSTLLTNFQFTGIIRKSVNFIKLVWNMQIYKNTTLSQFVAFTSLFGFTIVVLKSVRKKKYLILSLWTIISFLLVLILVLFPIPALAIVPKTYLISSFMFTYLFAGRMIQSLYSFAQENLNKKILEVCFIVGFIVISLFLSKKIYDKFLSTTSNRNVVGDSDIKSFDWINKNIPDTEKFIINGAGGNGKVFSTDGGGWLEIFTDNSISVPFYEYSYKQTDENAKLYYELRDNLDKCEYIDSFLDKGYKYYYQGSRSVFGPWLAGKEELLKSDRFELLFEHGSSAVYKLVPCVE